MKAYEYLAGLGYEGVTVDGFDDHATYFTGEANGKVYEFKSVDSDGETSIYGREQGKEDWNFMDDFPNEEAI